MRAAAKRSLHWAWVIPAICFVDLFINYSVRLGYGVVLPEMIRNLGFGRAAGDYFPRAVMGTVIGAWTPFYGLGAILTHWVTGILRDATGVYDHAFVLNILMGAVAVVLMALVRKR